MLSCKIEFKDQTDLYKLRILERSLQNRAQWALPSCTYIVQPRGFKGTMLNYFISFRCWKRALDEREFPRHEKSITHLAIASHAITSHERQFTYQSISVYSKHWTKNYPNVTKKFPEVPVTLLHHESNMKSLIY